MDEMGDTDRAIFSHPATNVEALKIKARVAEQYLDL